MVSKQPSPPIFLIISARKLRRTPLILALPLMVRKFKVSLRQFGRKTLYSLMGTGAYGNSGLNPPVSFHMWKTFALPRMLYGLEVSNLRRSDTVQLEPLQRSILRRLQCFSNNTANVAVYCQLGARPVEQEIDYKKLYLLASTLYSKNTIEFELACRQMAIKGNDSNS